MKSSPKKIIAALGAVLALALSLGAPHPAAAQIAGFRISTTNVDAMTGQVDFDVLLYGVTTPPPGNFRAGLPIDRTTRTAIPTSATPTTSTTPSSPTGTPTRRRPSTSATAPPTR